MTDRWPSDPGHQPPVVHGGAPPVWGAPPPATPAASSWPGPGAPGGWTPAPPPAPEPSTPRGPRGRIALVLLLVAVVAVLSSLVTLLVVDDDEESAAPADDPGATTTTTEREPGGASGPAQPSPPTTEPQLDREALLAEVGRLQDFIERSRGLEFIRDVEVVLLGDAPFEQRLLELLEEESEAIELQGRLLKALGLIEPDVDLLAVSRQLYGQGVLGFYDPETDELVVRGTDLTPYIRETILHELVHALDDQHFELHRPELDERPDEVADGFTAVIEGNAVRVQEQWLETLTPAERDERDREEASFALGMDVRGVPLVLFQLMAWPYEVGPPLVGAIADAGGEEGVNEALRTPPETTEQVLLPEKYFADEARVEVPPPPAEGDVIDEGVLGMAMLHTMLEQSMAPSRAATAAEGWAGDWYVAWEAEDGSTCIRVDVRMDDPTEAEELLAGLRAYAEERPGVEVSSRSATVVRLDGCTPPPSGGGGGSRLRLGR